MGGPSPPSFPSGQDVTNQSQAANLQTAQEQQSINTQTAQQQQPYNIAAQRASQYNTSNPLGSTQYVQTGVGPNGVPTYSAQTNYSPLEQALFGTTTGTQLLAGGGAAHLLEGANYGSITPQAAIGNMTTGITGQNLGQEVSSLEPFFQIQSGQQDAALRNQGISPTSDPEAYYRGMLPTQTGQASTVANFLASQEPTIQQQSMQEYSMPWQMAMGAIPFIGPTSPTSMQVNQPGLTPTTVGGTTIQPTNVPAAYSAENSAQMAAYNAQQAKYNAMMKAILSPIPGVGQAFGSAAGGGNLGPFSSIGMANPGSFGVAG